MIGWLGNTLSMMVFIWSALTTHLQNSVPIFFKTIFYLGNQTPLRRPTSPLRLMSFLSTFLFSVVRLILRNRLVRKSLFMILSISAFQQQDGFRLSQNCFFRLGIASSHARHISGLLHCLPFPLYLVTALHWKPPQDLAGFLRELLRTSLNPLRYDPL